MAKKITEIEGVGPAHAKKLAALEVDSVEKLLEKGATPKGREELVEQTGISSKLISRWVNHADLFRLKGVGGEYAELLEASGVDTVPELARRNAANLHAKMTEVNAEKGLTRRVPSEKQVTDWVAQAKEMDRAIHY
jgi:predicted flap endonuclease-1-like 5' DNA nuclease